MHLLLPSSSSAIVLKIFDFELTVTCVANYICLNLPSGTLLSLSWDHLLLFCTRRKRVTLKCRKSKFLQNKVKAKPFFSLPTCSHTMSSVVGLLKAHRRCLWMENCHKLFWRNSLYVNGKNPTWTAFYLLLVLFGVESSRITLPCSMIFLQNFNLFCGLNRTK